MIRGAVCFLYIICMVVYIVWAPNDYFWFGFNIISMLLFGGMCCLFLASSKKSTENERLLFYYMFGISIARSVYTGFCANAILNGRKEWVPYATQVFIFLVAVTFLLFLIYLARQKE